jgi:hypothetical protein
MGDAQTIACTFDDDIGDERDRLRVIQLYATLEAAAGDHRRHCDE